MPAIEKSKKCTVCKKLILKSRYKRHVTNCRIELIKTILVSNNSEIHDKSIVRSINSSMPSSLSVVCDHCGKQIQKIHFENHLKKKHKNQKKISHNHLCTKISKNSSNNTQAVFGFDAQEIESLFSSQKPQVIYRRNCHKYNTPREDEFLKLVEKLSMGSKIDYSFSELAGSLANILSDGIKNQSNEILNQILHLYSYYIIADNNIVSPKFSLDFKKINFDYNIKTRGEKINSTEPWFQIVSELDDEIYVAKRSSQSLDVSISDVKTINSAYLYTCLINSDVSDDIFFPEGVQVQILDKYRAEQGIGTIISLNENLNILYFQSYNYLSIGDYKLLYSSAWLIAELKKKLENQDVRNLIEQKAIWKIIKGDEKWIQKYQITDDVQFSSELNNLQRDAINHCFQNNITFIWGPPGTGKSTVLAELCKLFYTRNEKTLITTIANVAVDSVLLKSAKLLEEQNFEKYELKGKILRIGKAFSKDVLGKKYLFEINDEINDLRFQLKELIDTIDMLSANDSHNIDDLAQLKSEKEQFKVVLQNRLKFIYGEANLIYSTASNLLVDDFAQAIEFENIIIDEISMMNVPFLLWLSKFGNKRLIVAGDFRQLGPISLSNRPTSFGWMKKDIFQIINMDYNFKHFPNLIMLVEQYRMHQDISSIINEVFYNGKLITNISEDYSIRFNSNINNCPITIINNKNRLGNFDFTIGKSRINLNSQNIIEELLTDINNFKSESFTIGVITPYRAQAKAITKKLEGFYTHHKINVGTIHTFQGSESDVIILDFVDTEKDINNKSGKISRLYFGQNGERLLNVAISRAKKKLVIIGDLNHLKTSATSMTTLKFRKLIANLQS